MVAGIKAHYKPVKLHILAIFSKKHICNTYLYNGTKCRFSRPFYGIIKNHVKRHLKHFRQDFAETIPRAGLRPSACMPVVLRQPQFFSVKIRGQTYNTIRTHINTDEHGENKPLEFEGFRQEAGLNAFTLSSQKWICVTNVIGLIAKSGRYGVYPPINPYEHL